MSKKILVITQHFYPEIGSAGNRMKNIYQLLMENEYDISVYTIEPSYPNKNLYKDERFWDNQALNEKMENVQRIKPSNRKYSTNLFSRLLFFLEVLFKLTFAVLKDRNKYDYVFASSPPIFIGIVGLIAKYRFRAKLVFEVRDLWPDSLKGVKAFDSKAILYVFKLIEKLLYKKSYAIIVNSYGFVDYIQDVAKKPRNSIYYLPNAARMYELKSPNYIVNGPFRIIYSGNIGLAQNIQFIKAIAKSLNDLHIPLTIIGYGMKVKDLETFIEDEDLQHVNFIEPLTRKECLEVIGQHHVGLVSLNDNEVFDTVLPGKVVDYMTCQVPVIGSVSGHVKQLIDEKQIGFASEDRDMKEIISYILTLKNDSDLYNKMKENCYHAIRQEFLWENNVAEFANVFK